MPFRGDGPEDRLLPVPQPHQPLPALLRSQDPDAGSQSFEVQAGPIEYFPDLETLTERQHYPLKGGSAPLVREPQRAKAR